MWATGGWQYGGWMEVQSTICKARQRPGHDKQLLTSYLNLNFIISISSGCGWKEY